MHTSILKIVFIVSAAMLFYLPATQASNFSHYQQVSPQHHAGAGAGISFATGRRWHNGGNRYGHSRGHGYARQRGHGFNQYRGDRGHGYNRGNLHGFGHDGYYQKRRHNYRDRYGRSHYYYR